MGSYFFLNTFSDIKVLIWTDKWSIQTQLIEVIQFGETIEETFESTILNPEGLFKRTIHEVTVLNSKEIYTSIDGSIGNWIKYSFKVLKWMKR